VKPQELGSDEHAGESTSGTKKIPEILLESLAALAGAGEVEAACRLAGRACVALREPDPGAARRFDVLLHRLAPTLDW
jgi:hypothetical protein